MAENSSSKCIL